MLPADLLALRISDRPNVLSISVATPQCADVKMDAGAEAGLSLVHISQDGRSVRPLWRQAAPATTNHSVVDPAITLLGSEVDTPLVPAPLSRSSNELVDNVPLTFRHASANSASFYLLLARPLARINS